MTETRRSYPVRPPNPGRAWSRDLFLTILHTALTVHETRFARQTALAWLASFPGDLPVVLLYAQALAGDGHPEQAVPVLEELCQTDPEFLEASELLDQLKPGSSESKKLDTRGYIAALGGAQRAAQKGVVEQTVATWGRLLANARAFLQQGDLTRAEQVVHQALAAQPANPLIAATHLRVAQAQAQAKNIPVRTVRDIAEHYYDRWPECLQCSLLLAGALMDGGESERAVSLLHQAAARDVTGQVITRLWGESHPYRALWPERLEAFIDLPIPAAIAAALGWNRLAAGEPLISFQNIESILPEDVEPPAERRSQSTAAGYSKTVEDNTQEIRTVSRPDQNLPWEEDAELFAANEAQPERLEPAYTQLPETLLSVQEELDRVASRINRPGLARSDGRLPVYVIMTTRRGLETVYGPDHTAALEAEMRHLAEAVQVRKDWRAVLFYADEGVCIQGQTTRFAVQPAKPNDPWGLKLALADLDSVLSRRGEMIGAVLIVGGPEIVPFHHLPNPVDDLDEEVVSDNPYGSRDQNYFVPEWPVGRLPGGSMRGQKNDDALLKALRAITGQHMARTRQQRSRSWTQVWAVKMVDWLKNLTPGNLRIRPSYGYTAAVWKNASFTVFRPIGQPNAVLVSPPVQAPPAQNEASDPAHPGANGKPGRQNRRLFRKVRRVIPTAKLAYFNLHGLEDAVEWYGQSDPSDSRSAGEAAETDYPVALRPEDVMNSGRAPQVVFSEACYGAHILNKGTEEALALKFLQAGSQAVVGSTCTAYGSVTTPLIAADYLGQTFWSNLRKGLPVGEALRRAKIALAQEMHHRQGYLDGEDQKTLISFVLFGDPLSQPFIVRKGPKSILRTQKPPVAVRTICDRTRKGEIPEPLPSEVIAHVKSVVEQYLPGMADAHITLNYEHAECQHAGHTCPTAELGKKTQPNYQPNRRLIILSKQIVSNTHLHTHYARITLNAQNKLVKMVVSR